MMMNRMEVMLLVFLSTLVCCSTSSPISALVFEMNVVEESDTDVSSVTIVTQCAPNPLDTTDKNMQVLCTNHNFLGSACLFACGDRGLILSGKAVIVCEEQGKWSDEIPTCETVETLGCRPQLVSPDGGWMTCSGDGRSCVFGCEEEELVLIGRNVVNCGPEGSWDSIQPLCVESNAACSKLTDNFQHGYVSCSLENAPGSVCDFFCDEGYHVNGSLRLLCEERGRWSDTVPSCVPQSGAMSCEEKMFAPLNGFMDCTVGSRIGSICSFRCDEGFGTFGERFSICRPNGSWSEPSPSCIEMKCPSDRTIKGGKVVCTSEYNIGSLCRYLCNDGLILEGGEFSQCVGDTKTQSARWNNANPGCMQDPDKPVPVRRKFPSWLFCFMQPNQKSCLTKFFLICIVTGQKCL